MLLQSRFDTQDQRIADNALIPARPMKPSVKAGGTDRTPTLPGPVLVVALMAFVIN
jgi:hypothetical protein